MVVLHTRAAIQMMVVPAQVQEARGGSIQRRTDDLLSKVLISHAPLRTQVDHTPPPNKTETSSHPVKILE